MKESKKFSKLSSLKCDDGHLVCYFFRMYKTVLKPIY